MTTATRVMKTLTFDVCDIQIRKKVTGGIQKRASS